MARLCDLLVLTLGLTLFAAGPGLCVDILSVRLVGGGGEYIETQRHGARYVLTCEFRSGYDDPVSQVRWLLYGSPVYTWRTNQEPSAAGPLLGRVDRAPTDAPHNLHFTALDYGLAGNYTCEVTTQSGERTRDTYNLHVLDIYPVPFATSVAILSEALQPAMGGDEDKYITDIEDNDGAQVSFEDPACTLTWSLATPSIFPKPNVTCGFFSLLHDDVVTRLPAGLTMHQFGNGTWQASFVDTRVQVVNIPKDMRLGCTVRVPGTSYKETVLPEDDFRVDNLIDPAGCPSLGMEDSGLMVEVRDGTTTCRGDLLPSGRDNPVIAIITCPKGFAAVFPDGSVESGWRLEASCVAYEQRWRNNLDREKDVDVTFLPSCHPVIVAGQASTSPSTVLALTSLLALAPFLHH